MDERTRHSIAAVSAEPHWRRYRPPPAHSRRWLLAGFACLLLYLMALL